jgi:hypothetical protein
MMAGAYQWAGVDAVRLIRFPAPRSTGRALV